MRAAGMGLVPKAQEDEKPLQNLSYHLLQRNYTSPPLSLGQCPIFERACTYTTHTHTHLLFSDPCDSKGPAPATASVDVTTRSH